jgi:adenylate cyclase
MTQRNAPTPADKRIEYRIGINVGDIVVEDGDIFDDGVNVAARLEGLAEPGGICVSARVQEDAAGKLDFAFEDMGEQALKNIARPVRAYRVATGPASVSAQQLPAPVLPDKPSIAVLSFANMSGDPEQEYFADGITEDIIARLAVWRTFPVIARASTFTFKGKTLNIKKIAAELGAGYIVEGSVRKSGQRVRVTAQLIHADTGHHIMAERCDRDLSELFELQDEIVTAIAAAIEPELLKFERDRIAERPRHNEDAYELYQRGAWHYHRQNKADNVEAQRLFHAALVTNPDYPQAMAALALAVCSAGFVGWADDAERNYAEAYDFAQRAVALDGRYPNARFALGLACMYTRHLDRATEEFQEAVKLNPSFAAAHILLGQTYLYSGRPEKAIVAAERDLRLNPSDPRLFIWLPALAGANY